MKFNWGTGIAITLFLFAGLMGFMVYKATQQRFDLVSETYYEDEIAYQQIIDQKTNASTLKGKAQIQLKEDGVFLLLPEELEGKKKTLTTLMYFEQDARKDFNWEENNITSNLLEIPFATMDTGKWIAKIKLHCEGVDYYFEPQIIL